MFKMYQFGKLAVGARNITTVKENPDASRWRFGVVLSSDRLAKWGIIFDVYKIQLSMWWYR